MPREKRISEGKLPVYGVDPPGDHARMQIWRHKLHNEKKGEAARLLLPFRQLAWMLQLLISATLTQPAISRTGSLPQQLPHCFTGMPERDNYGSNCGVSLLWLPYIPARDDAYSSQSRLRGSGLKLMQDLGHISAPRPPPSVAALPPVPRDLKPPPQREIPRGPNFLDLESSRLQASQHARSIGQTFLRSGNLVQAKAYFKRAEQMLAAGLRVGEGKGAPAATG